MKKLPPHLNRFIRSPIVSGHHRTTIGRRLLAHGHFNISLRRIYPPDAPPLIPLRRPNSNVRAGSNPRA
jgi:hypothetical protein